MYSLNEIALFYFESLKMSPLDLKKKQKTNVTIV